MSYVFLSFIFYFGHWLAYAFTHGLSRYFGFFSWSLNLLNIHVVNLVAQPCVYPWFPDLRVYTEWDFPCSQQVYRQDTVVPGWRQVHFTNSGNILMNLVYLVITIDALSIWFYKRVINIRKKCDQPLLLEIDRCKPVVCNCFRRKLYF